MPNRHRPTSPRRPGLRVASLLFLAAACASEARSTRGEVEDLIAHGRYGEAVAAADRARRKEPGDAAAEELHRKASVAFLLEQGRRSTFADRDVEALEAFALALELDPHSREVNAWVTKTRLKLARRWTEAALELHARDDLAGAVEAYEQALRFSPGDPSAITGMASAVIQLNYRGGLGKRYFQEGLHALADYWLEQARTRFEYSKKYQPGDERPIQRRERVDELLAQQRVTVAKRFEEEKRYAAARYEYRLAVELDPKNEEARIGLERAKKEAHAQDLLRDIGLELVRGRFEQAEAKIEEGLETTVVQRESFEGAQAKVQEARYEQLYREALALQRDYAYQAAIDKYAALLAETPYYKDVLARKDTLELYVRKAAELYQQAEAAPGDAERLDLLRQIDVFWPEYRDVPARIEALEAKQAEPQGG